MTVQADYNIQTYEGNGETKTFTVPFKFFDEEIAVYKGKTFNTYQKGEDYKVENNGNGGEIVFEEAPKSGDFVTIVRSIPLNQLVTFIEGEDFPAHDYEYSLDRIVMALQEMWADLQKVAIPPAAISVQDFINNYYTKKEVDATFASKTELGDYYTKEEVDNKHSKIITITFPQTNWTDRQNYTGEFPKKNAMSYGVGDAVLQNAFITFNEADALSGNFSPVCEFTMTSNTASVNIFAKEAPTTDIIATVTFIY